MDNLARQRSERGGEVLGARGTVRGREGARWVVETDDGSVSALRATGCLLEPAPGDVVLVGRTADEAWVLTVLAREGGRSAEINVDGDLRLRAARGKIAVVAQEGIDLISSATTKIVSNGLDVQSRHASVMVDGLEMVGGWIHAELDKAKVVAKSLDQFLDRFSQRVRRSYRRVEDVDQLQAGAVHHRIEQTMRVHAKDTAITADGVVKIDASQIHVG